MGINNDKKCRLYECSTPDPSRSCPRTGKPRSRCADQSSRSSPTWRSTSRPESENVWMPLPAIRRIKKPGRRMARTGTGGKTRTSSARRSTSTSGPSRDQTRRTYRLGISQVLASISSTSFREHSLTYDICTKGGGGLAQKQIILVGCVITTVTREVKVKIRKDFVIRRHKSMAN